MPNKLKPRVPFTKTLHAIADNRSMPGVIVLKFVEGSNVRWSGGQFESRPGDQPAEDAEKLSRIQLDPASAAQQVQGVNAMLKAEGNIEIIRAWTRSEQDLAKDRAAAQTRTGQEMSDLDLYYYARIKSAKADETERVLDGLNRLAVIETAYPQYVSVPATMPVAGVDQGPVTGNFSPRQSYKRPAPVGIDSDYASLFPGGNGEDVRIVDVESAWTKDHEDFPPLFFDGSGINLGSRDHGTAVVGILAAPDNGYGVTGIAPAASIGVCTVVRLAIMPVPAAINDAASHLRAGDILLIEQHAHGPSSGLPCNDGNCGQWEYIAQEFWPMDFDAIVNAVALGIVVVEAAGNGGMDLDSPVYEGHFRRDSGAIVIGAGISNGNLSAHPWSNAGTRVNVQAWGDSVMTLQFGDIRASGDDERQFYATGFSGTSSASPIVTGAAACIQGIRRRRGLAPLDSMQLRDLLIRTGTPQTGTRHIGPLPDLRRAIADMGIATPRNVQYLAGKFVAYTRADGGVHALAVDTVLPWRHDALSDATGAPHAAPGSKICAYRCRWGHGAQIVYLTSDGHIHELFVTPGQDWGHADLTALTGAPAADGRALCAYSWEAAASKQVVYTTPDGHIHELFVARGQTWAHADLTSVTGAPPTDGRQVRAMAWEGGAQKAVFYTDRSGMINELVVRKGGGWTTLALSRMTAAPVADGRAMTAYAWETGGGKHLNYTTAGGHIIEFSATIGEEWHVADLTTIAGAPAADGRGLIGYAWEGRSTKQLAYTSSDGRIRELFVSPGTAWMAADLTQLSGGPLFAGGSLSAAAWEAGSKHIAIVVGAHIHEVSANASGWSTADLTSLTGAPLADGGSTAVAQ